MKQHTVYYPSHEISEPEEVVGVEMRPSPPPLNPDGKLNPLHAILQDHTYCSPIVARINVDDQTFSTMNPNLESNTVAAAAVLSSMPGAAKLARNTQQRYLQASHLTTTQHFDDDANSTISNSSHTGLLIDTNDPGEETETAPEGEEDSETRCICDLTHDDGYMICCDNCW